MMGEKNMEPQENIWHLPVGCTHEVAASAALLSFVGGAGDFDHKGRVRCPKDYGGQIKGAIKNIGSALTQENCSLADIIRVKAFVQLSDEVGEAEVTEMLLEVLPDYPAPVISIVPVEIQPFPDQKVQIQVIAMRGWREQECQFVESPLDLAGAKTNPTVTRVLRAGEVIATSNRTADHFSVGIKGEMSGEDQSHAIMTSLNSDLESVCHAPGFDQNGRLLSGHYP